MKNEILIRTYAGDAEWLSWCLRSCQKFNPELPVKLVCPEQDRDTIRRVADPLGFYVSGVEPHHKDGYMDQQWTKLHADIFCPEADFVIHMDSDCIWTGSWEELFDERETPILLYTSYDRFVGEPAYVWKRLTEKALGFEVENEYMRRQPLVYPRFVYAAVRKHLNEVHGNLWSWFKGIGNREFSEFNVIGAWCADNVSPDAICFRDTETEELPEEVMKQGWSWGGMTPKVKRLWEETLT